MPARNNRQTTLTDVAHAAGASPMTVSRVVTGNGYVSSELRRKVERVIARLGYSPNRLARSLKGAPTKTIGVLLPDLGDPFAADLARGIEEVLLARGYYPFVVSAEGVGRRAAAAITGFVDHRVSGAVLATRSSDLTAAALAELVRKRFPVVAVGPEFDKEEKVDRVCADYKQGAFEATRHLIESGHRRIAFLGSSLNDAEGQPRLAGYLDALAQYRIRRESGLIVAPARRSACLSHSDGYECMNRLLNLNNPPDAVFARSDFAAAGALLAMRERGIAVPDDMAIVGFDNVPSAAYLSPPLTTVNQFAFEQGRTAAGMLLGRIESERRGEPREERFTCELVVRESSCVNAMAA